MGIIPSANISTKLYKPQSLQDKSLPSIHQSPIQISQWIRPRQLSLTSCPSLDTTTQPSTRLLLLLYNMRLSSPTRMRRFRPRSIRRYTRTTTTVPFSPSRIVRSSLNNTLLSSAPSSTASSTTATTTLPSATLFKSKPNSRTSALWMLTPTARAKLPPSVASTSTTTSMRPSSLSSRRRLFSLMLSTPPFLSMRFTTTRLPTTAPLLYLL